MFIVENVDSHIYMDPNSVKTEAKVVWDFWESLAETGTKLSQKFIIVALLNFCLKTSDACKSASSICNSAWFTFAKPELAISVHSPLGCSSPQESSHSMESDCGLPFEYLWSRLLKWFLLIYFQSCDNASLTLLWL